MDYLLTPLGTELGDAVIRISVRISVQVNVDAIIVNVYVIMESNFIHYISAYFRVSESILFNFDI